MLTIALVESIASKLKTQPKQDAMTRFDADPKKCGRGWEGTKPPGCTRKKKGEAAKATTTTKATTGKADKKQVIEAAIEQKREELKKEGKKATKAELVEAGKTALSKEAPVASGAKRKSHKTTPKAISSEKVTSATDDDLETLRKNYKEKDARVLGGIKDRFGDVGNMQYLYADEIEHSGKPDTRFTTALNKGDRNYNPALVVEAGKDQYKAIGGLSQKMIASAGQSQTGRVWSINVPNNPDQIKLAEMLQAYPDKQNAAYLQPERKAKAKAGGGSDFTDTGNYQSLYTDEMTGVRGKKHSGTDKQVEEAAKLLLKTGGRNWVPVLVHENEDGSYKVVGNHFAYDVAKKAGLERTWSVQVSSDKTDEPMKQRKDALEDRLTLAKLIGEELQSPGLYGAPIRIRKFNLQGQTVTGEFVGTEDGRSYAFTYANGKVNYRPAIGTFDSSDLLSEYAARWDSHTEALEAKVSNPVRLDATGKRLKCGSANYQCGGTCLGVHKNCHKNEQAGINHDRLNKINSLIEHLNQGGEHPSKGLDKPGVDKLQETAAFVQGQRDLRAGNLTAKRSGDRLARVGAAEEHLKQNYPELHEQIQSASEGFKQQNAKTGKLLEDLKSGINSVDRAARDIQAENAEQIGNPALLADMRRKAAIEADRQILEQSLKQTKPASMTVGSIVPGTDKPPLLIPQSKLAEGEGQQAPKAKAIGGGKKAPQPFTGVAAKEGVAAKTVNGTNLGTLTPKELKSMGHDGADEIHRRMAFEGHNMPFDQYKDHELNRARARHGGYLQDRMNAPRSEDEKHQRNVDDIEQVILGHTGSKGDRNLKESHRRRVENAIESGDLTVAKAKAIGHFKTYPDLAAKYSPTAPKARSRTAGDLGDKGKHRHVSIDSLTAAIQQYNLDSATALDLLKRADNCGCDECNLKRRKKRKRRELVTA